MATAPLRTLALCTLMLGTAGCGDASRDPAAIANLDGLEEAAGDTSTEARDYVARFVTKDPETCFDTNVALRTPQLKAPAAEFGPRVPPTRVIVMIDGSGSMAGRIGGTTKLELAREAALGFISGLPPAVETSLLAFGQRGSNSEAGKTESCAAIDVLTPMSTDRGQLRSALGRVRAVGWTPLAAGLDRAEALLAASSTPGEQIIYVVSDGEETCGGDPVASARRINSGRTRAIVNVIGFNLPSSAAARLTPVAHAGGGAFVNVSNEAELERVTEQVREEIRQTDNKVATSIATTDNEVATSIAITDADTCISNLASDEEVAMLNDLTDREVAGHPVPFKDDAKRLMKARHERLRAKVAAYRARLTAAEATTKQRINAAAAAAR